tara:strand:- start:27 stop:602 length:576 start_codon:yes stop_codon:yes gene_type:complete
MAGYVLFISEDRLKDSTAINMNVDVNLLLPYVQQSQKVRCEPVLGTDLYNKLKDLISTGTIGAAANAAYKTLLDDYIADMLSTWSFHDCIPYLRFKTENGNIYSKTSETGTALSTEEAQHLREEIRNTAEYYTERLIEYICNNTSLFPEYNTNSGADINPDRNAYYNGINLETPTPQGNKYTIRNVLGNLN